MESNNWRPAQSDPPPNTIDAGDWRSLLQPDSRHRIVNKIMETLKKHLPFSGQDGLLELKKIAVRFEEKIYSAATSQSDYLRKISLKMLTMETKSQNTIAGSLATNPASSSRNPMEAVPQNMQPQVHNQGQSAPMSLAANQPQGRQQMLAQNLPGNIASAGIQGSAGSASTLSSVSGMNQNPISNVINQSSIQNMADASHNAVGSSMGQGVATNVFNNQKPVSGRQQVQPGQQQSQQQFMYQQQLQQQFMKQKQLQQGSIPNSLMQSHIQQQQQQNVLQPNQMQSSQQAGISTSNAMLQQHPQSSLSSVHQSAQSMLQQHPQSALRQQQQQQSQQTPGLLQQQMTHQPTVMSQLQTSQPQQPMMSQQTNTSNMQPTQLLGQQNMSDMTQQQQQQQQRLMNQQNNLSNLQQQQQLIAQQANLTNMHQQHMGHQGNVSGLQQQLHGTQSSNSGMQGNQHQMHMLHQNKGPVPQQSQQPASGLLASQGQQSQHPQTQMRSQIQSQSAQLQQQLGINQQQRDMQQRPQPAGTLMQPHNIPDQQKQMYQSQRPLPEASSTSIDSASQSGHANSADWQEEVYKKITVMKEKYLPEISELYQKISLKLQQHDSLPQPPKTDQLEKLRIFQTMLDRIITFLQVSKMNVNPAHRDKLASYEKQIVNFLNSNRPRKPGQVPPHMQSMLLAQSQNMQAQPHDNHMNPQLQSANIQSPVMMQQNTSILQHNPMSSLAGVSNTQQNMIGSVQPGPNVEAGQGGGLASLQQGVGGHNTVSAPQQTNMNALSSQNGVNLLQPNISNLQSNSNVNQQHLKEQQIMQSQQLKHQFQQRQMQQQMMQNQQLLQQQQLHHQTKQQQQQQQSGQMSAHQLPQVQQMGDVNDMNSRQVLGVKPGVFPQHHAAGQRSVYHQQMKPGVSFPMPSPQLLQTSSPQILQNSSPQMDQQNMLSSLSKAGTPLQSVNSPFVVPSPSTPLAPSPMPGDSEKLNSNVSTLTTAGNTRLQQSALPPAPSQSLAIGTPGISASPLLAEFSNHDATHGTTSAVVAKSSVIDQPLDRLIKAVKSVSNDAFTASVNDIGSVISMIDRIAGSAPGNGSRAAVGEDLVAMTKCRLQAKNFASQEGSNGSKKMKRLTSAMPLIVVSTNGSVNDSFKQHVGSELSDLESTATSRAKRPRIEVNHYLLEEIKEINQRLIETMLAISDEDADPSVAVAVAPEGGEGIIISCCYNAVGLSPNLKSQYASAQMSPIQPLRLLVPSSYPNCSPVLLDKLPVDVSNDDEDLSMKAKSKFSISLRTLSQPMSLGDIARTWDLCARAVVSEYAQASGGGSFSSRYGSWESVLSS